MARVMGAAPQAAHVDGEARVERTAERAVAALRRPGAYLEAAGASYRLRIGSDRRLRPAMTLDEPVFRRLVELGALSPAGDGWTLSQGAPHPAPPSRAGRPGMIEGERRYVAAEGLVSRRVNLGESPIAWLARRRDSRGQPWLTPAEIAAATRLRDDFERCGTQGRLTMDWSGMPRSGAGWTGVDPTDRGRAAQERVTGALAHAGPGLREVLERVILRGSALEAAERALDLPRRAGKTVLKLALGRLVDFYAG